MNNPLFYRSIVALNREAHATLHLPSPRRFGFAAGAHLIPALADEFAAAASTLAVAFLPGVVRPSPVFVAGLAPGRNEFVAADGSWEGAYLPAYLRRYPFIVGDIPGQDPVLCIDEAFEDLGGEGAPLFGAAGEIEPVVSEALSLADQYRGAALRTERMCDLLQAAGLLRPVTLDARKPSGETTVVHGLQAVNEEALAALEDARFLELRREGFLTPVYAHLFSLRALERLNERANAHAAA